MQAQYRNLLVQQEVAELRNRVSTKMHIGAPKKCTKNTKKAPNMQSQNFVYGPLSSPFEHPLYMKSKKCSKNLSNLSTNLVLSVFASQVGELPASERAALMSRFDAFVLY